MGAVRGWGIQEPPLLPPKIQFLPSWPPPCHGRPGGGKGVRGTWRVGVKRGGRRGKGVGILGVV